MKIDITALEVITTHGVHADEKVNPQPFIFDISLDCDSEEGAVCDDIGKTVNYSQVCALVIGVATSKTYNLIESLARECAFAILEKFDRVNAVNVRVSKPQAPIKAKFGNVSVSYFAERNTVYLSLGSSQGDREKILKAAISQLDALRGVKVERTSSFIKSAPVGGVAKNEFVNCAAQLGCILSPRALLDKIHTIEARLGRVRTIRWADRPIDIDIIFFGDKVIAEEGLAVPHPHYRGRSFVVEPLKELCPEKVCPLTHTAVKDM